MSRILFWLGLVFLVVFAIRSKLREAAQRGDQQRRQRQAPGQAQASGARPAEAAAETMLCCAHCGVYYPASETVQLDGRDYCCTAHAGLPAA